MLILFSGPMIGLCHGFFLSYFSRYGANQLYFGSIFSGAPLFDLRFKRSVKLGGIVPYLINVTVEKSSLNSTCN